MNDLPEVFEMYEDGQYAFLGFWAKGHWPPDKFGEGFRQCFGPTINDGNDVRTTASY